MSFIERLQNKPRFIRVQILWMSVILVMTIIFFSWLVYLKSSLQFSESNQASQAQIEEQENSVPSLFDTIKGDFSLLGKVLRKGIKGTIEYDGKENNFEIEIIKPKKLPE